MEEPDDAGEEGSVSGWVHPDDRLWRHPSEASAAGFGGSTTPASALAGTPGRRLLATALLAGVIGSLLTTAVIAAVGIGHPPDRVRTVERVLVQPVSTRLDGPLRLDVVSITRQARLAVVQVRSAASASGDALGTGVILTTDGHVITTSRVVAGTRSFLVVLASGREYPAKLVGTDPETDLAVLKIEAEGDDAESAADLTTSESLPADTGNGASANRGDAARLPGSASSGVGFSAMPIGSAVDLEVGQPAVSIGCTPGVGGAPAVSVGIISALGRKVATKDWPTLIDMIQTDAPLAGGSAGGALLDARGALVGITSSAGDGASSPLAFAIPVDVAQDVAEQIMKTGKVVHLWLGIDGEDAGGAGAVIRKVTAGSPAAKADLRAGDVVTGFDGDPVVSMSALKAALRGHRPGQKIPLTVVRDGHDQQLDLTLAERPRS